MSSELHSSRPSSLTAIGALILAGGVISAVLYLAAASRWSFPVSALLTLGAIALVQAAMGLGILRGAKWAQLSYLWLAPSLLIVGAAISKGKVPVALLFYFVALGLLTTSRAQSHFSASITALPQSVAIATSLLGSFSLVGLCYAFWSVSRYGFWHVDVVPRLFLWSSILVWALNIVIAAFMYRRNPHARTFYLVATPLLILVAAVYQLNKVGSLDPFLIISMDSLGWPLAALIYVAVLGAMSMKSARLYLSGTSSSHRVTDLATK